MLTGCHEPLLKHILSTTMLPVVGHHSQSEHSQQMKRPLRTCQVEHLLKLHAKQL